MSRPDNPRAPVRRLVLFSGRVQGVGFRFTTQHTAERFRVTGFVRNLPDGRVELVAEGAASELDQFQRAVEDAMRGCIDEAVARDAPATGEFVGFQIAR